MAGSSPLEGAEKTLDDYRAEFRANLIEYLKSQSQDGLVEIAMKLSDDCERLRRELDEAQGVIR